MAVVDAAAVLLLVVVRGVCRGKREAVLVEWLTKNVPIRLLHYCWAMAVIIDQLFAEVFLPPEG